MHNYTPFAILNANIAGSKSGSGLSIRALVYIWASIILAVGSIYLFIKCF